MNESGVLQSLYDRHSTSGKDRRCAAREALAEMTGEWSSTADFDSSLDFLAAEVSEQMMRELVRRWVAPTMGWPTSTKLAAMAERFYLEAAVAALDD
jgi:hypothetical protein